MKKLLLLITSALAVLSADAQIVINEGSYRNFTQVTDAGGNNPDWLELYNAGNESVSIWHYHLSDDPDNLVKWILPDIKLPAKQWILVYASGKGNSNSDISHWETAVREDDLWKWINPTENTPISWMNPDYDDRSWNNDQGGFGYGDGFVAYLNGTEIKRANMSKIAWNSTADASHEAIMFQGKKPESFDLDMNQLSSLLHNGENLLTIEGHNFTAGLIDMSLRVLTSWLFKCKMAGGRTSRL